MKCIGIIFIGLALLGCKPETELKQDSEFVKAIEANDIVKVKKMVNEKKVSTEAMIMGVSPAVKSKSVEMFKTLESLGFDMKWDKSEYTHLLLEFFSGDNPDTPVELISEAVRLGHSVNFQEPLNGYTPAMLLIKSSNESSLEKLKALKENGADFTLKSSKGETVYQMASNESIKKYLESIGAHK